jgi:hypothetical protein
MPRSRRRWFRPLGELAGVVVCVTLVLFVGVIGVFLAALFSR